MRKSIILSSAVALAVVTLVGCSKDAPIEEHDMIVILNHYPYSSATCGYVLEAAINQIPTGAGFHDTLAEDKDHNVTCADYNRDENNNSATNYRNLCFTHDYGPNDSDISCVIGTNINEYATGLADLIIGEAEKTED